MSVRVRASVSVSVGVSVSVSVSVSVGECMCEGGRGAPSHQPSSKTKSSFSGLWFVLALAGIRWHVVQIKAVKKDDVPPL